MKKAQWPFCSQKKVYDYLWLYIILILSFHLSSTIKIKYHFKDDDKNFNVWEIVFQDKIRDTNYISHNFMVFQ